MKKAATRPPQAATMLIIALSGWLPETATVLLVSAFHWGVIR
jgi:hypothetical protein